MKTFTKPAPPPLEVRQIFELINAHLYTVEERIRAQAREFDPEVEGYVAYACESNGKRLRPALALLSAGATGGIHSSHCDLAVVIELIHAATLVHDDIMDGADKRRGQPTANAKWGASLSVLLGDCLFAHALKLSTNFSNSEVSRRIAAAACDVCAGEIMQTQRRFDLKLSVADYYRIIDLKTAALFAAAAELGAFLNDSPPEVIAGMRIFGSRLGAAYQVYDDCLDLAGSEDAAGKTLGTDLRKGKLTLPLLHLLQVSDEKERHRISEIILRGEAEEIAGLAEVVRERGALGSAVASSGKMLREAQAQLELLEPSRYRQALSDICAMLGGLLARFDA